MKTSILKHDFDTDYKTLVICFAGSPWPTTEAARYEWVNFFKDKNVKTLHLRDYFQSYYMGNWFDELGNVIEGDVKSHAEFLSEIIKESGCDRVVTTGSSSGATASVLYGVLLNVDCVMAFNPQTYISKKLRWFSRLAGFAFDHATPEDQKSYFDLTNLDYEKFNGKIYYHWGANRQDRPYREHMKEFCKKHPHLGGGNIMNSLPDAKIYMQKHGINSHDKLCARLKNMGFLKLYFERHAL